MFSIARSVPGRLLALALAALLASPSLAAADDRTATSGSPLDTARLSGRVLGADGETPIGGAIVRIHYLDGGRVVEMAGTDRDGEFEVEGLPHGYADLVVVSGDETFVGNRFIVLPPSGRVRVSLALARRADRSDTWWAARGPLELPGGGPASGLAEVDTSLRGRDFWKSPAGIAILAAAGGALLLAITLGGRDDRSGATTVP